MLDYLQANVLPEDQKEARCIVAKAPSFCILNGVLCFIDSRRGNTKRVVVPQSLRSHIMTENHSGPCAGHFAGNKLYNMLIKHWYWRGMYEDVMTCEVTTSSNTCKQTISGVRGGHYGSTDYREWEQTCGSISRLLHKMAPSVCSARSESNQIG